MELVFQLAEEKDIDELTEMRIAFLAEDYNGLSPAQTESIMAVLPGYFAAHLSKDLFVYTARMERMVSCCYLLVSEKPANPAFPRGRTGTVLNVYTVPAYRRQGIAGTLLKQLLADAAGMGLDFVELKATDAGYRLYQSLGFAEEQSRYRNMKIQF